METTAKPVLELEWDEVSREQHDEALCVLPPAAWYKGCFLMGEPMSHDERGVAVHSIYVERNRRFFTSMIPLDYVIEAYANFCQRFDSGEWEGGAA